MLENINHSGNRGIYAKLIQNPASRQLVPLESSAAVFVSLTNIYEICGERYLSYLCRFPGHGLVGHWLKVQQYTAGFGCSVASPQASTPDLPMNVHKRRDLVFFLFECVDAT